MFSNYQNGCCPMAGGMACVPRCITGPTGATGANGATGPTGATGATGTSSRVGLSRGTFLFSSSTPTVISDSMNVIFNNSMTVQNLEFAAPSDDVIIQNTGVYQIFYAVLYSSASGSRLQLKQNGEGLTNTSVNIVAAPQGEVSAVVLLELSAGDALSLGITSGNVTLTTQGQSAILTMLQVG